MAKEMANIECQQIMVRYRFMSLSSNNPQGIQSTPPYVRAPVPPTIRIPQERANWYDSGCAQNQSAPSPLHSPTPSYDGGYRRDAYFNQSVASSVGPSAGYRNSPLHQMQNSCSPSPTYQQNTTVPQAQPSQSFINILDNPN